jgi:hypothetical protein
MSRKASVSKKNYTPVEKAESRPDETRSSEQILLEKAEDLLRTGKPKEALEQLYHSRSGANALANARAVCLLRLGHAKEALNLLRPLVVSQVDLRHDAPLALKVNFATALLLDNNVSGCVRALDEIGDDNDAVRQLRAAINNWRGKLSLWQKMRYAMGAELEVPVQLDFEPGIL